MWKFVVCWLMFVSLAASAGCASHKTGAAAHTASDSPALVAFADTESAVRLSRSRHAIDFFHLANQFESQSNKAFCGPATMTIVLNTLRADNERIEKPRDPSLLPAEYLAKLPAGFDPLYRRYTQNNVFTAETDRVKTRDEILGRPRSPGAKRDGGIQLRQLHELLIAEGLDSQLRVVDEALSDDAVRRELVANLGTADDYVVVNYYRPALGQKGGGHISPLAAYDEASDSFLILDVNPNGHTWVWAPAPLFIGAMRTFDKVENRGYLLVSEPEP